MFWFDKTHPNTIYIDNRIAEKGHRKIRPNHEVKPDIVMDFRKLDFPDKTFKLVVWDPPHMLSLMETSDMRKVYGILNAETWQSDLKRGFKECWRVMEDYGVLVFKWSESEVPLKKVLKLFDKQPLFGHHENSRSKTHWICFMKIPNEVEINDMTKAMIVVNQTMSNAILLHIQSAFNPGTIKFQVTS